MLPIQRLTFVPLLCCLWTLLAMPSAIARSDDWQTTVGGHMMVVKLASAPYPDDTRTTGFVSRSGRIWPKAGHYDDNSVVLFAPKDFRPTTATDFILHFHGHNNAAVNVLAEFELGTMLADSRRNAILVIPQGPKYANDSGCGKLERPGGFATMMADINTQLQRTGMAMESAAIGNIVLGGHSGAYKVIGAIQQNGDLQKHIKETWLYDSAYGNFDGLAKPAVVTQEHRLRSIYTPHLSKQNLQIMDRLRAAGRPFVLLNDSDLSTGTLERADGSSSSTVTRPEGDAALLDAWLTQYSNVFIATVLTHHQVVAKRRYFETWARRSSALKPI